VYLQRIERDLQGLPVKLYPFTRDTDSHSAPRSDPRLVVMTPTISFGRSCNRRHRNSGLGNLRAVQGRRLGRRTFPGLPTGYKCRRRSNPLRSRLTALSSSLTDHWASNPCGALYGLRAWRSKFTMITSLAAKKIGSGLPL
jgi:hypothetical protein